MLLFLLFPAFVAPQTRETKTLYKIRSKQAVENYSVGIPAKALLKILELGKKSPYFVDWDFDENAVFVNQEDAVNGIVPIHSYEYGVFSDGIRDML